MLACMQCSSLHYQQRLFKLAAQSRADRLADACADACAVAGAAAQLLHVRCTSATRLSFSELLCATAAACRWSLAWTATISCLMAAQGCVLSHACMPACTRTCIFRRRRPLICLCTVDLHS